jgi:bifunctional DNA-binding transcriptional regulator/antitoxin component of YhaV-PrlF toxin-antitoxin module
MSEMVRVQVAANGRLVLPKALRAALGLQDAGSVLMSLDDGDIKITSIAKSVAAAQALYRAHVVHDFTSDDFLAERRKEALAERRFDEAD